MIGYYPMLTRVTGEVLTAETLNRYVENADVLAGRKAGSRRQFRHVLLGADTAVNWWFVHSGANTLDYWIDIASIGGGTWALAVNGTTVKSAATSTGTRKTYGGSPSETGIDISGLGLVVGNVYAITLTIAGSTAPSLVVKRFSLRPTASWPGLPTVTDTTVVTAANMDLFRQALEVIRGRVDVADVLFHGTIWPGNADAYNDWPATFGDQERSGYHYALFGGTETEAAAWTVVKNSDTLRVAWAAQARAFESLAEGKVRLKVNATTVRTLTVTPTTYAIDAATPASFASPPEALYDHAEIDLTSLGLAENEEYVLSVTYQMATTGVAWYADPNANTPPQPDRLQLAVWWAMEEPGAVPSSYTPPERWESCDPWRGSTGAGPDLTELVSALSDLNTRTALHPNMATYGFAGPLTSRRRGRWLRYAPAGGSPVPNAGTLAYNGDITSVDPNRVPQTADLGTDNPGYFDLADVPVGDLYLIRADAPGPPQYALETDD